MEAKSKRLLIITTVWTSRILCGGAFIFSGFTKGIDPWGTIYKIEQYLAVWGSTQPRSLIVSGTFLLCAAEFLLGIALISGSYRRWAPRFALLFMLFFLSLTAYIVVYNPVSDCGCFGDALKLSNVATFVKNIVLTAMTVALLFYNKRVAAMFSTPVQWIVAIFSMIYIGAVMLAGYIAQPLIDFRDYPEGTDLLATDDDDSDVRVIYERNGEQKAFPVDDLPGGDSGWEYVSTEVTGETVPMLAAYNSEGDDVLLDEIPEHGDALLIVIPELIRADVSMTMYLNRLYAKAHENGINVFAITGEADDRRVETWRDLSMAEYPIYFGEDTQLKNLARGEVSLVYVKDGIINEKVSLSLISNGVIQEMERGERNIEDVVNFNQQRLLSWLTRSYIVLLAVLLLLSLLSRYGKLHNSNPTEA